MQDALYVEKYIEDIEEDDFEKIKQGYDLKAKLNQGLISKLELINKTDDNVRIYSNLAYLIAEGLVDIKIAFMRKGTFHYKFGVYVDAEGNEITSCGSDNLTEAAIHRNGESFDITCSWLCSEFDYGKIANTYDGDFSAISISPFVRVQFTKKDRLDALFRISSRRSFLENHDDEKIEPTLTKSGREWFFDQFAFSFSHQF